ncbi:MAG: hypothetical protein KDA90_04420 [Planctomycetaceae bacterium]|nr:hypothetical protein [Planctomycetaceae bacterium]
MSTLTGLSARQLQTIERSYGLTQGVSVLDVGCGAGEWVSQLRRRNLNATGLDDSSPQSDPAAEGIVRTAIAANLSIPVHSQDVAIIRGTQVFSAPNSTPETTIGLANVLSTIKPGGQLICAVAEGTEGLWRERLKPFQLDGTLRTCGTGLLAWLTLAPVLRPGGAVTVLEFRLGAEQKSRLEWHRLAREAVMPRKKPAAA